MKQLFNPPAVSLRVSTGLLLVRVLAGLAFMFHGLPKIKNPLGWMGAEAGYHPALQALAAVSEFGGGFCWILGLLTPLASLGLACTMGVAVYVHAVVKHDPFVAQGPGGAYEPAAVYLALSLLFLLAGPGRFSVDRMIFGEKG